MNTRYMVSMRSVEGERPVFCAFTRYEAYRYAERISAKYRTVCTIREFELD